MITNYQDARPEKLKKGRMNSYTHTHTQREGEGEREKERERVKEGGIEKDT